VRRGRLIAVALAAAALGAAPFACSSPPALLGAGGQCFQTTDCEPGLACVEQKTGPNVCSSNFASIVSTEEAGSADAPAMQAAEGGEAAPGREAGGSEGSAPSTDGPAVPESAPDVGTQPPPPETGPPQDVQTAPPEAAPPDVAPDTSPEGPAPDAGDASGD